MKKVLAILFLLAAIVPARAQWEFSQDVVRVGGSDIAPQVRVTVMANDKKQLQEKALLSVLDTYVFSGIEGIDDGKPKAKESERANHDRFFRNVYGSRSKYAIYVREPKETVKARRNEMGLQQAVYTITFNKNAFDKALTNEGIIATKKRDTEQEMKILPTIMVVPYRKSGENYRDVLDNNPALRVAVSKVQDMFSEHGYSTVDFTGRLEAAERDMQFAMDDADSFASQLIRNSGGDAYVVVDGSYIKGRPNNRLNLYLKAYYTADGRVIASKDATVSSPYELASLCKTAVHRCSAEFMEAINEWFEKPAGTDNGSYAKLIVTVAGNSGISLDSEVGDDGFTISDYIRNYVKKNAKTYKVGGITPELMTFDAIAIPKYNKKGEVVEVTDFAAALTRFIRTKGVNCTYIIDGMAMRLTISD